MSPPAWPAAYDAAGRGDYPAALAIWGPLAQAGVARAQNNVGACFAEGLGVERDQALALRWLTLAAEAGDPVGRRNLAALYFKGEGVEQDHARAAELYRAAAEAGDAPAQDMLSWMLLEGDSIPLDAVEAHRWAVAAAEQGVAAAMTRLGMIYHNALAVDRDPAAAAAWWGKAAARGDADGQAMLGAAHVLGVGVARDRVAALTWLLRARAGGSTLAEPFLKPARDALSADEIAEAERRAATPLPELVAMIIGTAGHIDHGKTALVHALTGVDTDRLKEEKARGITIDLGFAYLPAPDGRVLGFVDVPGHEKFVHNMLAGAGGIDFVLAGRSGRRRRHAADARASCHRRSARRRSRHCGADQGRSRFDAERREAVTAEIAQTLDGTGLAGADVVPVSIVSGEGIDRSATGCSQRRKRSRAAPPMGASASPSTARSR